ncbi:hypothetical protein MRX96_028393 [Rhipicephalus microplus]
MSPATAHSRQPATSDGVLEYWPLVAAIAALVILILLQLLFATPLRLKSASRARSAAVRTCESEECRRYAELFSGATNESAPACVNFYAHVCGRRAWTSSKCPMFLRYGTSWKRGNITWPRRNERPDFLGALFYMARRVFVPVAFDVAILNVDHSLSPPSKARTLFFGPPMRFLGPCEGVGEASTVGQASRPPALYIRGACLHCRRNKVERTGRSLSILGRFLRNATTGCPERSREAATCPSSSSTRPRCRKTRWDSLTKRYLNVSLIGNEDTLKGGVAIQSTDLFSAVFELHAKQGEYVTYDIVGGLCVQALVDYVSSDLLTSLLGGSRELATESIYERCFSDAYMVLRRRYQRLLPSAFEPRGSRL